MGGKASILLVIGFSLIFLIATRNLSQLSVRASDNYSNYFIETRAHNIALSGANIAANKVFFDPTWASGYSQLSFEGGTIDVSVTVIDPFQNIRRITSVGTYEGISKTIHVTLQPSKFSKFAYYSANEPSNIYWTSSDTVWGPLHVQGKLNVNGSPVFYGKVTTEME